MRQRRQWLFLASDGFFARREEMQQRLTDSQMDYLGRLAAERLEEGCTQQELVELWGVSQPAVSSALTELQKAGFISAGERLPSERGRPRQLYRLTGAARLIFGGLPASGAGTSSTRPDA